VRAGIEYPDQWNGARVSSNFATGYVGIPLERVLMKRSRISFTEMSNSTVLAQIRRALPGLVK